jgi:hypothetical protein
MVRLLQRTRRRLGRLPRYYLSGRCGGGLLNPLAVDAGQLGCVERLHYERATVGAGIQGRTPRRVGLRMRNAGFGTRSSM